MPAMRHHVDVQILCRGASEQQQVLQYLAQRYPHMEAFPLTIPAASTLSLMTSISSSDGLEAQHCREKQQQQRASNQHHQNQ